MGIGFIICVTNYIMGDNSDKPTGAESLLIEECIAVLDSNINTCCLCAMLFHYHCIDMSTNACYGCIGMDKQRMLINSNETSSDDDTVSNNHHVNQHHILTCSNSSVTVSPPIQETYNNRTKITTREQTRKIIDQSTSDSLITHKGSNNSDSCANNADTIKISNNSNKGNPESKQSNSTSKEMKQIEQKLKKREEQLKIKE